MRRAAALALSLALLAASGCATHSSRFAALSSQPVPVLGFPLDGAKVVPDVSAEVKMHFILWVPTSTVSPTLQDAVDAALERGGGNLLLNATVEHWTVLVPFLYGQMGWRVRGDVVQSRTPE